MVGRYQLFEFNDQEWVPKYLRDLQTDYLIALWTMAPPKALVSIFPNLFHVAAPVYVHLVNPMAQVLKKLQKNTNKEIVVLDCCSGSGGPTPLIAEQVNGTPGLKPVKFYLSDIYPRNRQWQEVNDKYPLVSYISTPLDATNAQTNLGKNVGIFRNFNLCFHHFDDHFAKRILKDCLEKDEGFMITEIINRDWKMMITMIVTFLPLIWILTASSIRPLTLPKIFFAYIIPLTAFLMAFDGVVSCLRTRSHEEIAQLMKGMKTDEWEFQNGVKYSPLPFTHVQYFIATRKKVKA